MEQIEERKQFGDKPGETSVTIAQVPENREGVMIPQQLKDTPSGEAPYARNSCGGTVTYPNVYALGRIETRFPSLGTEKEFAQATARTKTSGLTNQQTFHAVLSHRQNRYLARKLCWILTIEGIETYILQPRDPADFDLLIEAVRPAPSPMDIDVVIGIKGPIAPPEMCNGLMVPIVMFDQIYTFDRPSFLGALKEKRPQAISADVFAKTAEEVLDRIMQIADNAGATDEHRALNYLAVQYDAIYANTAECHLRSCSLAGIEVRPSRLSGTRKILDVIFSYTNRNTDVIEKYFTRVDVSEEFPFLVTKMSPYYDR